MTDPAAITATTRAALVECRNDDGGWGYYTGKKSRLEPTAIALIACGLAGGERSQDDAKRTSSLLAKWQQADGFLQCVPGALPNFAFNGIAAIALLDRGSGADAGERRALERLLAALVQAKGSKTPFSDRFLTWLVPSRKINRQNDELQGWSWVPGTFSWVEPTAWCLLALKKARKQLGPSADARIYEGEQVLIDRCCVNGGWNYGNSNMLGKELRPYIPTSAIALLAMQDRKEMREVDRSVEFLRQDALRERSTQALALAAIALQAYGIGVTGVEAALMEQLETATLPGNNLARSLALCALNRGRREQSPFLL